MIICNTLRRFLCQFSKKSWFWWSRQGRDGYSESDVFKRSRVMNRCTGMPRTWSGVLWIDFEVKIDLNIVLQRVELKRELDNQIQYHKTCTNESYRSIPNLDFSPSINYTSWHILSRTTRNIEQKWGLGCQFLCKTDDFPQNRVIDDNLMIFDVQSDCTGVKMCDNTFSRGFKRYCMVTEGARVKKTEKSVFRRLGNSKGPVV